MSITGNRETGGRPLSTADLAAAARRADGVVDSKEEPVLDEERIAATERDKDPRRTPGSPETRPAQDANAQPGGRWFSERGSPSEDRAPADTAADATARADAAARADGAGRADGAVRSDTPARSDEALEPLFTPELAETYRVRWTSIQSGFVDDPRQAVRSGDELVAQVMTNLADIFAEERHRVETQLDATGEGTTEELRVTLRRYRSFFERLLLL